MNNILFSALHILLTLAISAVPLSLAGIGTPCLADQATHITGLKRLSGAAPATVTVEDGQTVYLSTDSGGNALEGAMMTLTVQPLGYAFTHHGGTAEGQDISALFVPGSNTVTLDGARNSNYWLSVASLCPVQKPDATNQTPEHVVIDQSLMETESLANESLPRTTIQPVPVSEPDAVQRMLVLALTLVLLLMRIMAGIWVIAAVLLLSAGVVFAWRHHQVIGAWMTRQVDTIRKEVQHR